MKKIVFNTKPVLALTYLISMVFFNVGQASQTGYCYAANDNTDSSYPDGVNPGDQWAGETLSSDTNGIPTSWECDETDNWSIGSWDTHYYYIKCNQTGYGNFPPDSYEAHCSDSSLDITANQEWQDSNELTITNWGDSSHNLKPKYVMCSSDAGAESNANEGDLYTDVDYSGCNSSSDKTEANWSGA